MANDHLGVPLLISGGGFSRYAAVGACVCERVCTHSLSQPIIVPRSRQESAPSSSFSAIVRLPPPPSPASSLLSV